MKKWIALLLIVVIGTVITIVILNRQFLESFEQDKVENVETISVVEKSIKSEVIIDGYIQDDIVMIDYNIIQGKVKDVYVSKGAKVKTGTSLVRLDVRQYTGEIDVQIRQVKAGVDEIEVYKKHLARDKKKLKELLKNELLDADSIAQINEQIIQIDDQMEVYNGQAKGLDSQKYALYSSRDYLTDNAKFLSPCSGVIQEITVKTGLDIIPEHYIKIKKNEKPMVLIYVSERYLEFIKKDTALTVMLNNEKTYPAKVLKIEDGGGENLLFPVKVEILTDETLRNGLTASAYFIEYENKNAVVIPNKAIISFNNENYVYKVIGSKAVKTKVVLGISEADMTEVLSGLEISDQVIIKGQFGIKDGQQVNCNAYK